MRGRRSQPGRRWVPAAVGELVFEDRQAAGRQLADVLAARVWHDPLVLGLARGGVPVAAEVARKLGGPLGVAVARKIGAPGRPEFGVGAVTATGPPYYDETTLGMVGLRPADLQRRCAQERAEAQRRLRRYRADEQPSPNKRDVILIDDGLATGVTATAALLDLQLGTPNRLVFAAPVGSASGLLALRRIADEVVCLSVPESFSSVSQWYRRFGQISDQEVLNVLGR